MVRKRPKQGAPESDSAPFLGFHRQPGGRVQPDPGSGVARLNPGRGRGRPGAIPGRALVEGHVLPGRALGGRALHPQLHRRRDRRLRPGASSCRSPGSSCLLRPGRRPACRRASPRTTIPASASRWRRSSTSSSATPPNRGCSRCGWTASSMRSGRLASPLPRAGSRHSSPTGWRPSSARPSGSWRTGRRRCGDGKPARPTRAALQARRRQRAGDRPRRAAPAAAAQRPRRVGLPLSEERDKRRPERGKVYVESQDGGPAAVRLGPATSERPRPGR